MSDRCVFYLNDQSESYCRLYGSDLYGTCGFVLLGRILFCAAWFKVRLAVLDHNSFWYSWRCAGRIDSWTIHHETVWILSGSYHTGVCRSCRDGGAELERSNKWTAWSKKYSSTKYFRMGIDHIKRRLLLADACFGDNSDSGKYMCCKF